MNINSSFVLLFGCVGILLAGCGPTPRTAGIEFKARIETNLQATNSAETVASLEEMLHYMEKMKLKDQGEFFSAWPGGSSGCKAWVGDVQSKLAEMKNEKP